MQDRWGCGRPAVSERPLRRIVGPRAQGEPGSLRLLAAPLRHTCSWELLDPFRRDSVGRFPVHWLLEAAGPPRGQHPRIKRMRRSTPPANVGRVRHQSLNPIGIVIYPADFVKSHSRTGTAGSAEARERSASSTHCWSFRRGLTGFRLRPGVIAHDLRATTRAVVPQLQHRGFQTAYEEGNLRAWLGLARPVSRFAAV